MGANDDGGWTDEDNDGGNDGNKADPPKVIGEVVVDGEPVFMEAIGDQGAYEFDVQLEEVVDEFVDKVIKEVKLLKELKEEKSIKELKEMKV